MGFPGETAADFEATRSLVAELPVTYLHVFPLPRPGTPAADLPPCRPTWCRSGPGYAGARSGPEDRSSLRPNWARSGKSWWKARPPRAGWLQGLSDRYLRVTFPGPLALRNRRVMVRFTRRQGEVLVGEAVEEP